MATMTSPTVKGQLTWIQEEMGRRKHNYSLHLSYSSSNDRWQAQLNAELPGGEQGYTLKGENNLAPFMALERLIHEISTHLEDVSLQNICCDADVARQQDADTDVTKGTHLEDGTYVIPQ